jgi:glycosyltransferase involved in cell wall biosynthesis
MKILFVLPRIVCGGIERVTLSLAREILANGHTCELALRQAVGEFLDEARAIMPVYEVAPKGLHQFIPSLGKLIKRQQPTHVVTAFHDIALLTWLAIRLSRQKTILVHGVHDTHRFLVDKPGFLGNAKWLISRLSANFIYRKANAIVTVSEGIRQEILTTFHANPEKITTIYNPVLHEILDAKPRLHEIYASNSERPFTLIALGRLSRQKGFDVLIEAMSKVPMPWQLDIWGEGEERKRLEAMITERKLESSIHLCGYTDKPLSVLAAADLFVLSSRHEGLPTVLIEALACACRIVATDCPHGPREILMNGRLGSLVPPENPNALTEAIIREMENAPLIDVDLRKKKAEEFTVATAGKRWLLLLSLLQNYAIGVVSTA